MKPEGGSEVGVPHSAYSARGSIRRSTAFLTLFWLLQMAASGAVQIFIAAKYGTSGSLDVYLAGVTLPTTLFMIFASSFGIAALVYFHEVRVREGLREAHQRLTFAAFISVIFGIFVTAALLIRPDVVRWLTPGLSNEQLEGAAGVLRITAIAIPLLAASSILQGVLQANQHFYSFSLAALIQILLLPIFVLFGGEATPQALAWGFTAGGLVCFAVILAASIRAGVIKVGSAAPKSLMRLFALVVPLVLSGLLTHSVWVSERHFSSLMGEGSIAALNYSQRVLNLFGGALTYGVTTVLLPIMSARLEDSRLSQAGALNRKVLVALLVPTALAAVTLVFLSPKIVTLLFERGAFDVSSTKLTAAALTMYTGLLIANIYGAVVMKDAFAAKEGWLTVAAAGLMLVVFLLLAPHMIARFGFVGLPLTTSIAFMTNMLVITVVMARRHPHLFFRAEPAAAIQTK